MKISLLATLAVKLNSTSENPDVSFTYSLVSGNGDTDNNLFTIENDAIKTLQTLNYGTKVELQGKGKPTNSNGGFLDKELVITIKDINEAPTIASLSNQTLCYTPEQQIIALSGISTGEENLQTTQVNVSSNNSDMLNELTIAGTVLKYKLKNNVAGTAIVTITVTDNGGVENGGINSYSTSFDVKVNASPIVTVSSNVGEEIHKGINVLLTADGGIKYSWITEDGIFDGHSMNVRPEKSTTYSVKVTNENGCITEKEITINVKDDEGIKDEVKIVEATNILSPNGDGKNVRFIIKNIDKYPNNIVKIFDRTGRLVYSKINYSDEWDGTFNGSPLTEDTYFYIVDFGKLINEKIKGYITILRDK